MTGPGARLIQDVGARVRGAAGDGFVRDVSKLVSGTVVGRIIFLAALPIATRLYSPDDFAVLATYLGLVSIVAVPACLRFDIAIPLAETDEDAAGLLTLALGFALAFSVALMAMALLASGPLAQALGRPELAPYLWLVPLGAIMAAGYSALQYWATRARRFGSIARTRITQAAMGATALLSLGWAGIAPLGLLVGNMLNVGAGGLSLGIQALRRDRPLLGVVTRARLGQILKRYYRYPIYSMPEALANTAGIHLPVILIAAFAGAEAGFLLLATQIMAAPLTLLGSSIAQVYTSRAPAEKQAGRLASFTLQIVRRLVQIGVGPLILAGMVAPALFPLVFGADWARAGQIVAWLTPWMVLQFLASPVSTVLHQTNRQSWAMILQILGLVLRVGAILAASAWFPAAAVPAMAMAAAGFYAIYLIVDLRAAGVAPLAAMRSIISALIYVIPWILAGISGRWILGAVF